MVFYIVEISLSGIAKSLSILDPDSQHILTSVFRLNRIQKSKLQYVKVKLYRILESLSSFTIADKYILNVKKLPEFEKKFAEVYSDFSKIREEIYNELVAIWPNERRRIEKQLIKSGYEDKVKKLKTLDPPSRPEELVELRYRLIPLSTMLRVAEEITDEHVKKRMEREAERIKKEIEAQYREKIQNLENQILELKQKEKNLKKLIRTKEYYLARLNELLPDINDVSNILGEETSDELKERLEAIKIKLTTI